MKLHVLYYGFHGRPDFGALGWGTVSLLETDDGPVLIDAGGPSQRSTFAQRLRDLGYEPADIKTLLLSHMHWDHVYNMDLVPNAELVLSREEYAYGQTGTALDIHPHDFAALQRRKYRLFSDGDEVIPGVFAHLTPGHTPGCASFAFTDDTGARIVVAADALKNRAEISCGVMQTVDRAASEASIRKILTLGDHILPGHDGWIDMVDGKPVARGGNDVRYLAPLNMTINGAKELILHMDM